jgi:hypothetical protein
VGELAGLVLGLPGFVLQLAGADWLVAGFRTLDDWLQAVFLAGSSSLKYWKNFRIYQLFFSILFPY